MKHSLVVSTHSLRSRYLKPSELFRSTKEVYLNALSCVRFRVPGAVLQVPHGRRMTSSAVLGEEGTWTHVRSICQI